MSLDTLSDFIAAIDAIGELVRIQRAGARASSSSARSPTG